MKSLGKLINLPKHIQMDSTSNICDQHPLRVKKPIYKVIFEGKEICPVCESNRKTAELSNSQEAKIKNAKSKVDYNTFRNKSILTDIGLLEASFGNYEASEPEVDKNKKSAMDAYEKYKKGAVFNTWLTGSPGVGKSHLAMSILRNLNESGEKDKQCLFISVDEMLLKIRDSFSNKESKYTEFYFVDLLSKVDFLVLDDLGAETGGTGTSKKATDFTLRVLYSIANARQNKPTIITSNLTRIELTKMYDPKLVSRLMKDTHLIKFESTSDKRIKKIEF
ncbi:MAG: ATP-binding protein [Psychrobacillus psychrodurans]